MHVHVTEGLNWHMHTMYICITKLVTQYVSAYMYVYMYRPTATCTYTVAVAIAA